MNRERILVIIVNFNGFTDTLACIDSILKSTIKADIMIIDNASKEREDEKIKSIYSNILTIRSEINLGFSGGNNLGIEYALGHDYQYVLLLNNDTVIAENMIEKLLLASGTTKVTVPTMYYYSEPNKIWYGGGYINKKTGNAIHKYINCVCNIKKNNSVTFITGCCIMLPAKILRDIGRLNDSYFMYCEDVEYSIKIQKSGYMMIHVADAKLWHKIGNSSGGDESNFTIYYMTRNRLNCIRNNSDYFFGTAYSFSLITRYIRMIQYFIKGKQAWKAFHKGIIDHKRGIKGFVDVYII